MECYNQIKQVDMKGSKKKTSEVILEDESDDSCDELVVGDKDDFESARRPQVEEVKTTRRRENNVVHLHFQQRTTRKCLTIVQGLPDDLDFKKIVRAFKKAWCCNGTTLEHQEWGNIIQLQGDHRREISKFLIEEGLASKDMIKVHGY